MPENLQSPETVNEGVEVIDASPVVASRGIPISDIGGDSIAARSETTARSLQSRYILLPLIFLTSALFGGLRIDGSGHSFVFLRPPLICLVLAVVLMLLFARGGLVRIDDWLSEKFGPLKNTANATVLVSVFAASTQLFNSLLPEAGLPFWVVGFCFVWTLWNDLFSEFDPKRTVRSLAALFGLAFIVKYLLLANLTAPSGDGWLRSVIENPGKEAMTWLLDLPRFSAATGYIQFFTVILYFAGLYFLPASTDE